MASKAGRKRKMGQREPNGRLKSPTKAQIVAAERSARLAEKAFVCGQPHRRDAADPESTLLENALGRFCLGMRLDRELRDAGEEWASINRRWRAAKGIPVEAHCGGGKSGGGPSERTVAGWTRDLMRVESALMMEGRAVHMAARQLCIDGNALGVDQYEAAKIGLRAVAVELGLVAKANVRRAA